MPDRASPDGGSKRNDGWGGARKGGGGRRGPGPATIRRHRFIVEWLATTRPDRCADILADLNRMTDRAAYLYVATLLTLEGDPIASIDMLTAARNLRRIDSRGMLHRTFRFLEAREKRRLKKEMKSNRAKSETRSGDPERPSHRSSFPAGPPAPVTTAHPRPPRSALYPHPWTSSAASS